MRTSFVRGAEKFRKLLNSIEDLVTIILSVLLVVIVFFQVFFRYALNNPLAWSEELARFTFVWLVFISSAVVVRDDSHMSMDFVVSYHPSKQICSCEHEHYSSSSFCGLDDNTWEHF